jgi:hypothetical protein
MTFIPTAPMDTALTSEVQLINRVQDIVKRLKRTSLPDNIKQDIDTIDRGLSFIRSETKTLLHELGHSPYNFEHPDHIEDKLALEATTRRVRGVSFENQAVEQRVEQYKEILERTINSL